MKTFILAIAESKDDLSTLKTIIALMETATIK